MHVRMGIDTPSTLVRNTPSKGYRLGMSYPSVLLSRNQNQNLNQNLAALRAPAREIFDIRGFHVGQVGW